MGRKGRTALTSTSGDRSDPAVGSSEGTSDAVLARRSALGDRRAFALIVKRHGAAMYRYAVHMLDGHEHDAEDAVQTALIKAWQHLPGFRGDAELRTWLFTIVSNEVYSARRRRHPQALDDDLLVGRADPAVGDPADRVVQGEIWYALGLALTELPWRQRASWLLREIEGLSYEEIAAVLETSTTVVRGQLHRARSSLAVRMAQWR